MTKQRMDNNEITIKLTKDESLVLFEFLSRFNQTDNTNIFEDQAEQKTLWAIEGQLEKILVEPFKPDYLDIIKEARNRLRD
jgi:hypothetical protein